MNAKQALSKARTLWGKNARVEDRKVDTSEIERQKARDEWAQIKHLRPSERPKGWDAIDAARFSYRYSVGTLTDVAGMFTAFHVRGVGDTWEEAFSRAQKAA